MHFYIRLNLSDEYIYFIQIVQQNVTKACRSVIMKFFVDLSSLTHLESDSAGCQIGTLEDFFL